MYFEKYTFLVRNRVASGPIVGLDHRIDNGNSFVPDLGHASLGNSWCGSETTGNSSFGFLDHFSRVGNLKANQGPHRQPSTSYKMWNTCKGLLILNE